MTDSNVIFRLPEIESTDLVSFTNTIKIANLLPLALWMKRKNLELKHGKIYATGLLPVKVN